MSITRERLNEIAMEVSNLAYHSPCITRNAHKNELTRFAHVLLKAVEAEMEVVGQGLFDSEGKCHAIGQHRSSMCVGGKAFKSEPLIRLPLVKG